MAIHMLIHFNCMHIELAELNVQYAAELAIHVFCIHAGIFSQCQTLSTPNTVSLSTGVQAILPDSPFFSSGLLKQFNIQINKNLAFDLQIWRPENKGKTFSNVWSVIHNSGRQNAFHQIGNKILQWRSEVGVPVRPGYVFGVFIFKTNDSMPLTQYSKSSLTQSRVYYMQSDVPLCNMALCTEHVHTLDNIDPFIQVTVLGE